VNKLPEGWATALFSQINCFSPRTLNPSQFSDEIFELFSVPSFPNRKPEIVRGEEIGSTKQIVEPDDVLVCKINPRINRVWKVTSKREYQQIASSEWIVMRSSKLNAGYLAHYFSSAEFRRLMSTEVSGVGGSLTRVPPKRVAAFPVKIAPLKEQKQIADKLNSLLARVDACRDRLDLVSHIIKRFRQAVLDLAISRQLRDWRFPNELYADRDVAILPLSRLLIEPLQNGRSVRNGNGAWVLRLTSIRGGKIDLQEKKQGIWTRDEATRFFVQEGDFLVARGNGSLPLVGRGGLVSNVTEEVAYPDTMIRIRPNTSLITPEFLALIWNSNSVRDQIEQRAKTTSGLWKISQSDLEGIMLEVPTIEEQSQVVLRVKALFAYADRLEVRNQNALKRVEQIASALLSVAFRGELVPQDPNDEAATILLERIRAEQIAKPKGVVVNRKPKMPKMTEESVKEVIRQLPSETFSFNELREKISGDYDLFKDILFTLLSEAEPSLVQVFDQESKVMRFMRRNQ